MRVHIARRGSVALLAAAAALMLGIGTASAATGTGSAFGAQVNVTLLGMPVVNAGPIAQSETTGPTSAHVVNLNLPNILTVGALDTSATADPTTGDVNTDADTLNVGLPLLQAVLGNVSIKVVDATCSATSSGTTGSATILGANLGSLPPIAVNPPPNTQIPVSLPLIGNIATLTFNEQIQNADGSLTVNGLHIHLLGSGLLGTIGSGDVVLSSNTCG